ncbi:nesprin-3-like isoform X2 [Oncorhynchus masou masou]|uniref:nesprin-3-like isoform X2 n=1 Tax=Oncorhynchus masou masou TaxID=90313 RepID=UPI0031844783
MTHQEQQEILFRESLEAAMSWMKAVQERLQLNDNTQGPRAALEARLRETEKIHQSEHEGHLKFDKVLVAAEVLLQNGNQETRNITHARLKELKALWEETCTYIIHCHSRIEWVWLHWSEYLKAYEEFEMWLVSVCRSLEPEVELQLGVKEKLWQVDNQRVLLSDVQNQALLLERLVDEAAALNNRIQDPSVDQEAQERLQLVYNSIRDKADERLSVLQKMAEEHQMYQRDVLKFQAWLVSKTKELNTLTETEDTAENKLRALQTLDDNVASEERTLQQIEVMAEAVRANTSPGGADVVVEEAEALRLDWQRLRQSLCEAGESLKSSLESQSQYQSRCQRLGEDIGHLRGLLHRLTRDLETTREGDRTRDLETAREGDRTRDLDTAREGDRTGDLETAREGDRIVEQMVGQWRKYMNIRNTLLAEESQVERLKAQLKELFRFSQDSQHLSDDVLAVVKEQQSVKCRAMKLCVESELGLRQVLQDPLHGFSQWSQVVSQVLESSAEVSEFSHVAMLVQNIQGLLKHSLQLQEQLRLMLLKRDLLCSVFGSDSAESLMTALNDTVRKRELLHNQLLQRKARLQGFISRTKDFGDACKSIRNKLTLLRERLISADSLQPDILAKKSQSDQQRVIKKDLEDCEAHITALETLVSSSSANRTQFERLYGDWRILYKSVRVKVKESEESIGGHESFHVSLLNVEKWLMIMRQKLESYRSSTGEWSLDNRQQEAERALGEFPEKELQLHQTEVQGHGVLERTSEEGRVHILRDMKHLRESWMALHDLSLNLFRLLNGHSSEDPDLDTQRERGQAGERPGPGRELFPGEGGDMIKDSGSSSSREGAPERSPGEGHGVWLSQSSGVGAGRGGRTGLGGRLERGEGGESFGAEEGIWVEGAFEVMDLSEHRERQGRDRQTLGQQLSPMTLTLAGSQRLGQGGGSGDRETEREKERGGGEHSLGVEEVDSSIVWRGGYGQRGEEGTTGMTSGHTRGRSTHGGGRLVVVDSGSRVSGEVMDSGSRVSGVVGDSGSRVSGVVGDSGSRVSGVVGESGSRVSGVVMDSGSRVSRVVGDSGSRVSGVVGDSGSRVSGVVGDSGSRVSGVMGDSGSRVSGVVGDSGLRVSGVVGDSGSRVSGVVWDSGSRVSGVVGDSGSRVSGVVRESGSRVSGVVMDSGSRVSGVVGDSGSRVSGVVGDSGLRVSGVVGDSGSRVSGVVWDSGSRVSGVVRDSGSRVSGVVGDSGSRVSGVVGDSGSRVSGVVGDSGSRVSEVVGDSGSRVSGVVGDSGSRVSEVVGDSGSRVSEVVRDSGSRVSGVVGDSGSRVSGVVRDSGSRVSEVVGDSSSRVSGVVGDSGSRVSGVVRDSGSRVSEVVGDSSSRVSEVVGDSGSRVSGVVGDSGSRVSGVVVVDVSESSSSGQTEECVDGQRSRGMAESLAMEVDVGLGSGSGLEHGSRGNYDKGTGGMRDHSEGGHLRHRGFFPPIKTRMEDSVMDGLTARKPSGSLQGSSHHTTADVGATLSAGDYEDRRREFEAWLQKENGTLSGILSTEGLLSTKELKIRQNTLMTLRSSVDWGQEQFQLLLMTWAVAGARADRGAEDVGMEEIRYRWMLYKSKLKDVGDLKALLNVKGAGAAGREEHTRTAKEKTPGLLYRVCRVALPLWLLLLALLLFAFFLPWMDEASSCSLSNNFARSFNIMLRYHGPPPT